MHPRYYHVAAAEPSALTEGETHVYKLHCARTENVRNPIILWLSKITGNWSRREHCSTNKATSSVVSGKGGNAMPWFTARSWKLFVFSDLWLPGLCHWEPLTVLFPRATKNRSPGYIRLWVGVLSQDAVPSASLSWHQIGEDWPYIPKLNQERFCCTGFKPIFASDRNISCRWMPLTRSCVSREKKVNPSGCLQDTRAAFSFPLLPVKCHPTMSLMSIIQYQWQDNSLAWTEPTPEPSWSLAGVGFIAWWRPREMFQLQTTHRKWARRGGGLCQSCYSFPHPALPFESRRDFFLQKKHSWFTVFLLIRCYA